MIQAIQIAIIAGAMIYRDYKGSNPQRGEAPSDRLLPPKEEEGSTVPVVFGRCRVRRPVIAWHGRETAVASGTSPTGSAYAISILYALAIPFANGDTRLWAIYFVDSPADGFAGLSFPGNLGTRFPIDDSRFGVGDPDRMEGYFEFGDGAPTQSFAASLGAASMVTYIPTTADKIPGYRGYATVFLELSKYNASLPEVSFEVSTYRSLPSLFDPGPLYFAWQRIGDDANPADVIAAILCDQFGKLGRAPADVLDFESFRIAAQTLSSEGHGYSTAWDEGESAQEMLDDVLRQIDGVLYEEPRTGLLVLKLRRPDYSVPGLTLINEQNCVDVQNFDFSGWSLMANAVFVKYESRERGYQEATSIAQNQANAYDGGRRTVELYFRGCKTAALAEKLAARELAAVSRPVFKARLVVSRAFWNARPGDVYKFSWSKYGLSNAVIRVAAVSRGLAHENVVYLDVVQEYFYIHRGFVGGGGIGAFPGGGLEVG